MAEGTDKWRVVAEVDPDGDGGTVANYPSPRQADLLAQRFRKEAAAARGETGPNVSLTPDEARITGEKSSH
ncbi:hypothetical protein HYW83_06735 [Candidatus Peregrinibacteria bacterium]|nr:hypothetical protein [Candidatus Peregrinibacteria bacterium]